MANVSPGVRVTVTDNSLSASPVNAGYVLVQGPTLRGEKGVAHKILNANQFRRELGGRHPESKFTDYCLALLQAGVPLYVIPAGHYANLADRNTLEGDKATGTVAVTQTAEVRAVGEIDVTVAGTKNNTFEILVNDGGGADSIGTAVVTYDSPNLYLVAEAIKNAVNANTPATGYEAIQDSARATSTLVITNTGAEGDTADITVDEGGGPVSIGSVLVPATPTASGLAILLAEAINAGTASHGYQAAANAANIVLTAPRASGSPANGYTIADASTGTVAITTPVFTGGKEKVLISAPVGSGAAANAYTFSKVTTGTVDGVLTNPSGGVTAVFSQSAVFEAKEVGAGYNTVKVEVTDSSTGDPNQFDVIVTYTEIAFSQTFRGFDRVLDAGGIVEVNTRLKVVELSSVNGFVPNGEATLSGGLQNVSNILAADYGGNDLQKTGWYAGDEADDPKPFFIADLHLFDPIVNESALSYIKARGEDMQLVLGMPLHNGKTLPYSDYTDYLEGTGIYSHTRIDDRLAYMVGGQFVTLDPEDLSKEFVWPGVVLAVVAEATKNATERVWESSSDAEFYAKASRYFSNILRVDFNFLARSTKTYYDDLYRKGVNMIGYDEDLNAVVIAGNRSMLVDQSKRTAKWNVSNLATFLARELPKYLKKVQFKANVPQTWRELDRAVSVFIVAKVQNPGALKPGGRGVSWEWLGDQFVDIISDDNLTINTVAGLDAGEYKAILRLDPASVIEFPDVNISIENAESFKVSVDE